MKATYFIQGAKTGMIKIGRSKDPIGRLSDLQSGASEDLILLGYLNTDVERHLHRVFADLRSHGEWFYPEPKLIEFIMQEVGQEALRRGLMRYLARLVIRGLKSEELAPSIVFSKLLIAVDMDVSDDLLGAFIQAVAKRQKT